MTSEKSAQAWESLQEELPQSVLLTLVQKKLWNTVEGPTERWKGLTVQLARYFGFYPDSETLRAEFKIDFGHLDQKEQDSLFRLVKSLDMGRFHLRSAD